MKIGSFTKNLFIIVVFAFILTFTSSCSLIPINLFTLFAELADTTENNNYDVEYDDNGEPVKLTEYKDGKIYKIDTIEDRVCTKREYYYGEDTIGHECTFKDGILQCIRYTEEDRIGSIDRVRADDIDGRNTLYISTQQNYPSGDIESYTEYDETGKYQQKHTEYREDGTVEQVREYNEHGLIKLSLYDEKGELIEWTEYTYDENGKVISNVNHTVD